jgi:hypothetical protein
METLENLKNLDPNKNPPREGKATKLVEGATSRVPSLTYLAAALGSMAASAALAFFTRKKEMANFIGLWVPSLMLVGIYNKLVKLEGSDRAERSEQQLGSLH